jgi:iron(III) transport system ATP-binding protein
MNGLKALNISHSFDGVEVVKNVSITVQRGQVVCLLGPSGCGKTTLLRIAAGLETIQNGQVLIEDKVVANSDQNSSLPPEERGIGFMFQDYALFPHLSVRNNIAFGRGADTAERKKWINKALKNLDLISHANDYPHTLSGGQQQRVALLRALAPEPSILFLDEPFSSLDMARRAQVRRETLEILKQTKIATLMVTHDPEEAMYMADKIIVMNEGCIIQQGSPVETYKHPASSFVASLFGPVNVIPAIIEKGKATTPLGSFDAPKFSNGEKIIVLIRPENLQLTKINSDSKVKKIEKNSFEVISARPHGRESIINLYATCSTGKQIIEARISGVFLPIPGSHVNVKVTQRDAHMFSI